MRTIRFARRHRPEGETEGETKGAEAFLVRGWRLPVKADDGALAFGQSG
jgi:hypothetical protein